MFNRILCALALLFALNAPAFAQMSSYEREKIDGAFNARAVQPDPTIFDGETFVTTDKNAARKYVTGFVRGTQNAVRAVNGLSSAARTSEEGQALAAQANEMVATAKTLQAAYENFGTVAATASGEPAASAGDGLTDAQRSPVADPLDAIDALMAKGIFDGTEIDATVTTDEASTFADAFIDNANSAAKALNAMPGDLRRTPGGKELFTRLSERLKQARALNKALRTHAALRKDFETVPETTASTTTPPAEPAAPTPAAAAPAGDPKVRAALDAFNALMSDGRYDGKAFVKELPLDQADAFQKEAIAAANAANDAFSASSDDSLKSEVKDALYKASRIQGAIFNHRVVRQRIEGAESKARAAAAKAAADAERAAAAAAAAEEEARAATERAELEAARAVAAPSCAAFADEVMTSRNKRGMAKLFKITLEGQNTKQPDVLRLLESAAKVAPSCADPKYAAAIKTGCTDEPTENATVWCENATNAKSMLAEAVVTWGSVPDYIYPDLDKIEDSDGWWAVPLGADFEAALAFARVPGMSYGENTPETFAVMNAALGITEQDYPNYKLVMKRAQDIRELIEDEAGNWPEMNRAAEGDDTNYGTELAGKRLLEIYPGAELVDSWLERASWKIIKNDLGIIQRRTLPGMTLIKPEGDPYCQARSFTLTEQYIGGSNFAPAKGVRFGYTRFQDCDRR